MPKVGRKTAHKLINEISYSLSDDRDLMDFLNEKGKLFKLPLFSQEDFDYAFRKTEAIITESEHLGIRMISFKDDNYPCLLAKTTDLPIILNYKGDISLLSEKPTVAIIGTREPTDFGMKLGTRLSEVFASNGFNIVSGLAVGCDTAGHRGALNVSGTTTAVLAHGLDKIYPKENRALADQILEKGGVLVSEYFVKQTALANFFIERDRIQAGLSLGTIVVETDVKGGTMHTVKFTLENNRVLATLNHPSEYLKEPKTQGNQLLIRERKARPIYLKEEVDDLIISLKESFRARGSVSIDTSVSPKADIDISVAISGTDLFSSLEPVKDENSKDLHSKNEEEIASAELSSKTGKKSTSTLSESKAKGTNKDKSVKIAKEPKAEKAAPPSKKTPKNNNQSKLWD
ncbi:DNA-processing protein DprA [Chitinophaga sp. CF418]|uniref:DNA-processing protein DprA n=1 Tax=Chitinophaga sp. CF418 TaxID=1855287 RepID=UPI00165F5C71|nr:DNA-processing protein DprA [Chitinophaga sp. CF418]